MDYLTCDDITAFRHGDDGLGNPTLTYTGAGIPTTSQVEKANVILNQRKTPPKLGNTVLPVEPHRARSLNKLPYEVIVGNHMAKNGSTKGQASMAIARSHPGEHKEFIKLDNERRRALKN